MSRHTPTRNGYPDVSWEDFAVLIDGLRNRTNHLRGLVRRLQDEVLPTEAHRKANHHLRDAFLHEIEQNRATLQRLGEE
ncbi:MAG: hypothetical protein HYT80_00510 [Euryarchaeota archaeon]|nr:hypothetical protein [Euryarchaeota archaeon]